MLGDNDRNGYLFFYVNVKVYWCRRKYGRRIKIKFAGKIETWIAEMLEYMIHLNDD